MTGEPLDAIEALLPAYALNALEDEDRALVDGALEQEPRYRQQLAEYLGTVAQLASMHPAAVPSAALRERVLASRPPLAVLTPEGMGISSAPIPRQRTGRVWRAVGTWAAAAAVVLVLGGLGSLSYTQQQEVGELKAEMEALVAQVEESEQRFLAQQALVYWIAQPDVTTVAMRATNIPPVLANFGPRQGEPRGLLMRSPNGESVLVAINLTPLPEYYSYQAWAWDSLGRPYSLGVFEVDERGYAQVLVDYPHHAGEIYVMTVSVEPAGGSATPSQQTVIVGVVESQ